MTYADETSYFVEMSGKGFKIMVTYDEDEKNCMLMVSQ
jgi:hypothetical protein